MRSALTIVAGMATATIIVLLGTLVAAAVLAGPQGEVTTSYLAANLAVSLLGAAAGAMVVARFAPRRPFRHVLALAVLIVALALPGLVSPPAEQPSAYPVVVLLVGLAGLALGALWQGIWLRKAS